MNITLDVSKGQLSKLRNGHGIRISPTMLGSGVEMIIDPKTYHNIEKHMKKGKGKVFKMGSNDIEMNKMEGTGLFAGTGSFAGAGNQSGKISRIKKAKKWRDFSVDTAKQGIDVAKY
jgi:hypothetical protein